MYEWQPSCLALLRPLLCLNCGRFSVESLACVVERGGLSATTSVPCVSVCVCEWGAGVVALSEGGRQKSHVGRAGGGGWLVVHTSCDLV